jgi:hypothetical protein
MKKSILLLTFLNKKNYFKTKNSGCFVYRYLSGISLRQVNSLTKRLNTNINKLFTDIFSIIVSDKIKKNHITILSKYNQEQAEKLNYFLQKNILFSQIKNDPEPVSIIQHPDIFDKLSLKFELKIVKRKILLSYFYTDDFILKDTHSKIIFDYQKLLKKLIENPYISIKELINIVGD